MTSWFDGDAMRDIDRWVRTKSTRMLYVYGGNDPWGAEPFDCGRVRPAQRQCSVHVVDGGTHGARIAQLPEAERLALTRIIQRWAGLPPTTTRSPRSSAPASRGPRAGSIGPSRVASACRSHRPCADLVPS